MGLDDRIRPLASVEDVWLVQVAVHLLVPSQLSVLRRLSKGKHNNQKITMHTEAFTKTET